MTGLRQQESDITKNVTYDSLCWHCFVELKLNIKLCLKVTGYLSSRFRFVTQYLGILLHSTRLRAKLRKTLLFCVILFFWSPQAVVSRSDKGDKMSINPSEKNVSLAPFSCHSNSWESLLCHLTMLDGVILTAKTFTKMLKDLWFLFMLSPRSAS